MKIEDKSQYAYVVTREGADGTVVPCAIFINGDDGQNTVDGYNQLYKDEGIEGYTFKLHITAFYKE